VLGMTTARDMNQLELITTSPEETQCIGHRLGEIAEPGDVFLLVGELGAGKTCLTQGITRGLGIQDYASSPSFVIMRELYGRLPLYHIDLFRLERLEEIGDLGLDDYLYGSGVSVIEWANRGLVLLPEEHLLIEIEFIGDTHRRLRFTVSGGRYERLLTRLKADCLKEK
jgi:tRNA threonylcarbamoyladenosine biosynthesis protein TsaE